MQQNYEKKVLFIRINHGLTVKIIKKAAKTNSVLPVSPSMLHSLERLSAAGRFFCQINVFWTKTFLLAVRIKLTPNESALSPSRYLLYPRIYALIFN